MTRGIGDDAVISRIRLENQSTSFVGDPASGYSWLYATTGTANAGLHLELDDGNIVSFLNETEVNDLIVSSTPTQLGSYLISGGNVIWQSGLIFRVSAAHYIIQSVAYTSAEGTITLDVADGSNPRIDVIGIDDTGTIFKVTGTPASDPLKPDIDPHTQLELSFVLVAAGVTEPEGVTNTSIFLENAGSPTEWVSTGSASFNANSTNNPRTGSKCLELTNAANGNLITFTASVPITLADQEYVILYIRNKAAWASAKSMRVEFRLNGVLVGTRATIDNGLWGFNHNLIGTYQLVAIPIPTFAVPTTSYINQLTISVAGTSTNLGLYIDDVVLQGGVTQAPIGLTQEQADARYIRLPDVRSVGWIIGDGVNTISTGTVGYLEIPFGGTVNRVRVYANQTGTAVVDIWKGTYASPPVNATSSIVASAKPKIYTGTASSDSTLTGWTTAITADDVLQCSVDIADVKRLTVAMKVTRT